MTIRTPRPAKHAGFTMVEMLVALVVLGIGLLGLARLFMYTLQGNASAASRVIAINLAADMADRIRANRTANTAYTAAAPVTTAPSPACVGGTLSTTVVCTPAQMAAYDLYLWNLAVGCQGAAAPTTHCWAGSPAGTIAVTGPNAGGTYTYAITITWFEAVTTTQSATAAGSVPSYSYTLTVQI